MSQTEDPSPNNSTRKPFTLDPGTVSILRNPLIGLAISLAEDREAKRKTEATGSRPLFGFARKVRPARSAPTDDDVRGLMVDGIEQMKPDIMGALRQWGCPESDIEASTQHIISGVIEEASELLRSPDGVRKQIMVGTVKSIAKERFGSILSKSGSQRG